MAAKLTLEQSVRMYGGLMKASFVFYQETTIKTMNFGKTMRFIRDHLYCIDANPRRATLTLFLHYNMPDLEQFSELIWDEIPNVYQYEHLIKEKDETV